MVFVTWVGDAQSAAEHADPSIMKLYDWHYCNAHWQRLICMENVVRRAIHRLKSRVCTMREKIDWRLIRGLGELQVLTRASYLMLIVVPLLAGLWPGIRLVIFSTGQISNGLPTRF